MAVLLLLAGCGNRAQREVSWTAVTSTPTDVPARATSAPKPTATAGSEPVANAARIKPEDLKRTQPNELGRIPILMYHVITTDASLSGELYRTVDEFRGDLQWLYDHDFYTIGLNDLVHDRISVPAGKHPVVLTFDDGTSFQFSYIEGKDGTLSIDPDCAVGVLEDFFKHHPDFGHSAHFAPILGNRFAIPDDSQSPWFDQKIKWLVDNGYEVGNHTIEHVDMTDIPDKEWYYTITEPMAQTDDIIGDVPGNTSRILTVPFGAYPDPALHPNQVSQAMTGYVYNGVSYRVIAMVQVGHAPSVSPSSTLWDPSHIERIAGDDDVFGYWQQKLLNGDIIPYTSDGDPNRVAVPSDLPEKMASQLSIPELTAIGMSVLQYNPKTGAVENLATPDKPRTVGDRLIASVNQRLCAADPDEGEGLRPAPAMS